ncbi:MAG: DUF1572 domain-containing protein [Bacteroidia bacterium]|nr:DUF1572 domain-containing protein [Bacteroidia bacterium]
MNASQQLAKHLREIHFGGNWTCSNLKDHLSSLNWSLSLQQVQNLNSIATLTVHSSYYVKVLKEVLEGKPLNSKDEYSFQLPLIQSQQDWENLLETIWKNAEETASLLEQMPEEKLYDHFTEEKYGNYFRNIIGIVEHLHYHLGQIVLIKKLIQKP